MKAVRELVDGLVGADSLVRELVSGVSDHWRDRAANPLSAAFLVFAAAFNYKLILVILSFESVSAKLALIDQIYSSPEIVSESFFKPLAAAFVYVFIYAFIARIAHRSELAHKRKLLEARHYSDGVTLLTKEESRKLRTQSIEQAVRHQEALSELTESRDSLREQLVVAVNEVRELKLQGVLSEPRVENEEARELASEIVELRTQISDLQTELDLRDRVLTDFDPRFAEESQSQANGYRLLKAMAVRRGPYSFDDLQLMSPLPRRELHRTIDWMASSGFIVMDASVEPDGIAEELYRVSQRGHEFLKKMMAQSVGGDRY